MEVQAKMDIVIPILFFILAFFFLLIAIFEDREEQPTDEEQESQDNIVAFLLILTTIFFFAAGACMMSVTESYYSPVTDMIEETAPIASYMPLGWLGIFLGFFAAFLTIAMGFNIIDHRFTEG